MGPTGVRARISNEHETILIIGNQISLALLHSYGPALRQAGNRVIYVASFKNKSEIFSQLEIERCADVIIWTVETGDLIKPNRPQDYSAQGDAIQILHRYALGKLTANKSEPEISLNDIDRIYVIGNAKLLKEFQAARQEILKELLVKNPVAFGSVYSTMQCMLKGVCAQCLQWQIDPETGKRTKAVFACSWPDQPLEIIDFENIDERQIQNRLQEKLTNLWIDYLLAKLPITQKVNFPVEV